MISITRKLTFDAGHRVLGHLGKCKSLHGHLYVAEVTVQAPELNELGMVIDFGAVKSVVGEFIDKKWDHNLLLNSEDPLLDRSWPEVIKLIGREPYLFQVRNPTAENIAEELFHVSQGLLSEPFRVVNVRIHETPNCWADYSNA